MNRTYKLFMIIALIFLLTFSIRIYQSTYNEFPAEIDVYSWASYSQGIVEKGQLGLDKANVFPHVKDNTPVLLPLSISILKFISNQDLILLFEIYGPLITTLGGLFIFLIGRKIFNNKVGAICFLIYAILPNILNRSVISVSENYVYLFLPLFFYFITKWIIDKENKYFFINFLLVPVAIFAHQSMILLIIPLLVSVIFYLFSGDSKKITKIMISSILSLIILFTLYNSFLNVLNFQIASSQSGGIENTPGLPFNQYASKLGIILFLPSVLGLIIFLKNNLKISLIYLSYIFALILMITLLPSLGFSNNPHRFVPYLGIVLIFPMGLLFNYFIKQSKIRFISAFIILSLLVILVNPLVYPWEITSKQEIQGLNFVKNYGNSCLIVTQPANLQQVRFFADKEVFLKVTPEKNDFVKEIFTTKNSAYAFNHLQTLGGDKDYCIFISKYKLNYNHPISGWWNQLTYKNEIDLSHFSDINYFSKIYENNDSLIYFAKNLNFSSSPTNN